MNGRSFEFRNDRSSLKITFCGNFSSLDQYSFRRLAKLYAKLAEGPLKPRAKFWALIIDLEEQAVNLSTVYLIMFVYWRGIQFSFPLFLDNSSKLAEPFIRTAMALGESVVADLPAILKRARSDTNWEADNDQYDVDCDFINPDVGGRKMGAKAPGEELSVIDEILAVWRKEKGEK